MSRRAFFEFAGFQCVWLTCAMGAAWGTSIPALLAAGIFVAMRVISCGPAVVLPMALLSCAIGFLVESLFVGFGLIQYAAAWPSPHLAPAWIVALWLAFGATLETMAHVLGARAVVKASFLGAVFGPLSYAAGSRLGALEIEEPLWLAYCAFAGGWALSFPLLIAACRRVGPRT